MSSRGAQAWNALRSIQNVPRDSTFWADARGCGQGYMHRLTAAQEERASSGSKRRPGEARHCQMAEKVLESTWRLKRRGLRELVGATIVEQRRG
jgi:hypothetical protein